MTVELRGGLKRGVRAGLALSLLALLASACAPVFGGGALVVVVGLGALTSHCYDYLDVTVLDDQGRKTCAPVVTASNRGDEFELKSCYYAPLSDGIWKIRARLPGFPDATSIVVVDHSNDCTRHVQSMELTLTPPKAAAPMPVPAAPPPPPPPAPVITVPEPATAAPPAPPAPAPATSSSAAPAVGVFPDSAPSPAPAQ